MDNSKLLPYELPFHFHENITDWVFDSKDDFIFQFKRKDAEINQRIIDSINSKEHKPLFENANEIHHHLEIRTYGVLTGRYNKSKFEADEMYTNILNWMKAKLAKY